jgi:hypothetical protein
VLALAAVVGTATGCPMPPPPPLPVPPPRPCDPATMRCPRDLGETLAALGISRATITTMSEAGEIVGHGLPGTTPGWPPSASIGFRISPGGAARPLKRPGGSIVPGAVNSGGVIAGWAVDDSLAPPRAVVVDANDRLTELTPKLPTFGGSLDASFATDVNELGQVAGHYYVAFMAPDSLVGVSLVFVWDSRTDTLTVLNPEERHDPWAALNFGRIGIDDNGAVVSSGSSYNETISKIVRWAPQPGGTYARQMLGAGIFTAVGPGGDVLAEVHSADDVGMPPAIWPAGSSTPTLLPPPPGWVPNSRLSFSADDVNRRGEVVGTYSNGPDQRPIRWPDRASRPVELLETHGRHRVRAEMVNEAGTILGTWISSPADLFANGFTGTSILLWDPVSRSTSSGL